MPIDNFDTAYEPVTLPFFVYNQKTGTEIAAGTYDECVRFIDALPNRINKFLDIRRNN